jgi:hypothetical protein
MSPSGAHAEPLFGGYGGQTPTAPASTTQGPPLHAHEPLTQEQPPQPVGLGQYVVDEHPAIGAQYGGPPLLPLDTGPPLLLPDGIPLLEPPLLLPPLPLPLLVLPSGPSPPPPPTLPPQFTERTAGVAATPRRRISRPNRVFTGESLHRAPLTRPRRTAFGHRVSIDVPPRLPPGVRAVLR